MRLARKKVGFIGVDVGTATLKVAQVERNRQGWHLAASAVVPRQQSMDVEDGLVAEAVSSLDELRATRSLQQGYRGRRVAAALPMAICDLHRLDRDLAREANPDTILRQTIETATQQSADGLLCDYWSGTAGDSTRAWSQAIALPRSWSDQICEDIGRAGWSCESIDGLPLSMARAVNMVHTANDSKPVAALDWGNHCATLCFIENHQPTYVRGLKVAGLGEVLEGLSQSLQISDIEAQSLLEQYGTTGHSKGSSDDVAMLIKEAIAEVVSDLEAEIERSFSHFQFLRRTSSPQHLYLMGGGAMVNGLDKQLSNRLELKAKNWQLGSDDSRGDAIETRADCLFTTAIALSALAWESA